MREKTIKLYQFHELSDEAQEKAIHQLYDINVNHGWWDFVFHDAENVGIKIKEFDLDRRSYCKGELVDEPEVVAETILRKHGASCKTFETAKNFLEELEEAEIEFENCEDYDPEYMEFKESTKYEDIVNDFEHEIFEDYRIILQRESVYLTSDEAIRETIEANEYEFTEDGQRYSG